MSTQTDVDPKVVLITGASSGIGEATARGLAAGGHRVFLGARRTDRLAALVSDIRDSGGTADHHELDVTSLASMRAFAEAALAVHGHIDVLVNNAGVMPLSTVSSLRIEEWDQMIDVNLRGTLHGIAAALPLMEAQGHGHIVNVASVSGLRVDPTSAVYSATKFAVRALSEGLRQESTTGGASSRPQTAPSSTSSPTTTWTTPVPALPASAVRWRPPPSTRRSTTRESTGSSRRSCIVSMPSDTARPRPASAPVNASAVRATPLELFFDLVYVFAFTQVTHLMAGGGDLRSILGGLAVLGVLWWSWASHAWLANQRVADRGAVRVGIIVAIALVLVLSIAIPEVYPSEGGSRLGALLFAIGFVVSSAVYTVVNLLAARGDRAFHGQVLRTMGVTLVPVSAALIVGAVVGGTTQLVLWLAAVALEGVTIFATSQGGRWELPSAAHYAERHGLVVILALGESIISIGVAASSVPLTPAVVGAALLAVAVALALWWGYFGRVSPTAEAHIDVLTGNRRTSVATLGTYLHFGIVAGILLVSLGLGGVIEAIGLNQPPDGFSWAGLTVGLVLFVVATTSYSAITRPGHRLLRFDPRKEDR